ncbi:MAG: tripartite tricarboxylate transporter substrate binding protein [Hyphomicrobiales bacterium]|nr:tripartite tricarboxylate transporter substrate binding protein [Hyphomicrobiales bacterium]
MSDTTRRQFTHRLAAATGLGVLPASLRAQSAYPSRPVRFVLPFAAAGVADITSRLAAEKLGDKLGQRFVVENQPGPGGIAAARAVLSQAPDGYTLGLVTNGTAISAAIYKSLPFDPVKEFATISTIGAFDLVLASNVESDIKSLGDFLKAAREQPGKLNVGTIAVGSTQNLGAELLKSAAGLNFQIVPSRGTPDVIVALLRNDIQMMIDFYAPMKSTLLDRKIRPLATSGAERSPFFTDVPTVAQAGVPGYEVPSWNGMFAPLGTPPDIIALLNRSIREIVAIPEVQQRYAELGIEAKASSPEELKAKLENDIKRWAALIDRAGIQRL